MADQLVSQQKLTQAIKRTRAQLELDRAAGKPVNRSNLNRRVLDELEQTLAEARDNAEIAARRRAQFRAAAAAGGDTDRVEKIDALPAIHVPTSDELQAERQRLHRQAVQVLAPIYLMQREPDSVPATAPPTPDVIKRDAPQLKASGGPLSSLKPTVLPPVHQVPAAAEGTLILGAGLALVATSKQTKTWLVDTLWNGKPPTSGIPSSGVVSLVLFIGVLVVAASLSQDLAQVTLWLMLALWIVFLVKNPAIVQTAAGWISQGAGQVTQAQAPVSASTPAGPPNLGTGGPH